jgi:hypothetical protein
MTLIAAGVGSALGRRAPRSAKSPRQSRKGRRPVLMGGFDHAKERRAIKHLTVLA